MADYLDTRPLKQIVSLLGLGTLKSFGRTDEGLKVFTQRDGAAVALLEFKIDLNKHNCVIGIIPANIHNQMSGPNLLIHHLNTKIAFRVANEVYTDLPQLLEILKEIK